jgi:hypothetical protein
MIGGIENGVFPISTFAKLFYTGNGFKKLAI